MQLSPRVLFVLAGSWLTVLASANVHAVAGNPARVPIGHVATEVLYDEPGDGALYAVGRGWKARFDVDGTSFIPFLGSDAPRDEIVHLALRDVRVDGAELAWRADARPSRSGDTIRYARGSVDELYTASLDGLEHSFELGQLPAREEIVVRCTIETSLVAREVNGVLEFANERGGVRYSDALARDATGRRCALALQREGHDIVLRLPREFVRAATLPLTIDPLLQVFGVATTPAIELAPDASATGFDTVFRRCEVWETIWSQTDHDVTARVTSTGSPLTIVIDATTDFWSAPKVASMAGFEQPSLSFQIVAAVGLPSSGARQIRGRFQNLGGAFPAVTISAGLPGDHHSPDVGGDPYVGDQSSFVVWQRDSASGDGDILGEFLDWLGGPLAPIVISGDPMQDDTRPAVSKSDSIGLAGWTVVFERRASPSNRDIWATTGFFVQSPPFPVSTAPEDESSPSVSSFDGVSRYVIAYSRDIVGQSDIELHVLDNGIVGAAVDLSLLEGGPHAALDQVHPSVDGDANGYVVAYKERDAVGSSWYRTRYSSFALSGAGQILLHESHQPLGGPTSSRTRPGVSSDSVQVGGSTPGFEVVWDESTVPSSDDVYGALFVDGATAGTIVASCFGDGSDTACPCAANGGAPAGCPNSAHPNGAELRWSGQARTSADTLVVHSTRLPPNAVVLLAQGTSSQSPANVYGDGLSCLSGTETRVIARVADASGEFFYPASPSDPTISAAGGVPAAGGLRVYQIVYRDPPSFCTPSAWNTTNALRASWIP